MLFATRCVVLSMRAQSPVTRGVAKSRKHGHTAHTIKALGYKICNTIRFYWNRCEEHDTNVMFIYLHLNSIWLVCVRFEGYFVV